LFALLSEVHKDPWRLGGMLSVLLPDHRVVKMPVDEDPEFGLAGSFGAVQSISWIAVSRIRDIGHEQAFP